MIHGIAQIAFGADRPGLRKLAVMGVHSASPFELSGGVSAGGGSGSRGRARGHGVGCLYPTMQPPTRTTSVRASG